MPANNPIQDHYCPNEARIAAIEARLQNKKENLHEVHEDYYHLREKLEIISTNVVELTTLMKKSQEKEDENDKRFDKLQKDVNKANIKIEKTNSSLDTMKWLIPVACAVLTFIVNYLI